MIVEHNLWVLGRIYRNYIFLCPYCYKWVFLWTKCVLLRAYPMSDGWPSCLLTWWAILCSQWMWLLCRRCMLQQTLWTGWHSSTAVCGCWPLTCIRSMLICCSEFPTSLLPQGLRYDTHCALVIMNMIMMRIVFHTLSCISSSVFISYISGVHHFWWDFCVCDHFLIQVLK